ncbi:hypothetical protein GCK32_020846 [Trichostrongylus colubriformis]|uniref:Uncharacterized protein n=1 Tax=Trichostrongylus colubriformis TaxID=6319 RepID=A0AAN8IJR3_TRICO
MAASESGNRSKSCQGFASNVILHFIQHRTSPLRRLLLERCRSRWFSCSYSVRLFTSVCPPV